LCHIVRRAHRLRHPFPTRRSSDLTYSQALDEALCFGWIDGVRRSVNSESYMIRFTPRKPKSIWSLVNVRRAELLEHSGRMAEPRSEEHTSELQSRENLVCRLLLEK